jgi:hypothetical protein
VFQTGSLAGTVSTLGFALCLTASAVDLGSLLDEILNLDTLCERPLPAYRTVQFSSADRGNVAPYRADWFGNADGFGGEPVPNVHRVLQEPGADGVGSYVLAEVEGPGAIVRLWSARINGDLRVILDGDQVLYEGPAEWFLQDAYGSLQGVVTDTAGGFRQEEACYFPIPFASGLRMEWTGKIGDLHFYEVVVRCYEPGTTVRSLRRADLAGSAVAIATAAGRLSRARREALPTPAGDGHSFGVAVAPGEFGELLDLKGPARVLELSYRADATDTVRALRQTVLRAFFDGASRPQVEAPLGDLCASFPGVVPFHTLPVSVSVDGWFTVRFPMPFAERALVTVRNLGDQDVRVEGRAVVRQGGWDPERSLHFHAKWRVDHGLWAGGLDHQELPFLAARGRGVFVGTAVLLRNPIGIITLGGGWWGEGDERIWVDHEPRAAFLGTGSEDYFNYSWSRNTHFQHAFCGQPLSSGPGSRGHVVNLRWQIPDPVPFMESFFLSMELMHHSPVRDVSYARITYLYADADLVDDHRRISAHDVALGFADAEPWEPSAHGHREAHAVYLQAEDADPVGDGLIEVIQDRIYARDGAVLWAPTEFGQELRLRLSVPRDDTYDLLLVSGLRPDAGAVEAWIGDHRVSAEPVVLRHAPPAVLRSLYAGTVELDAGEHTVRLRAVPPLVCGGLEVIGNPALPLETQGMVGWAGAGTYENGDQLFWRGGGVGDALDIRLKVTGDGDYVLQAAFTRAPDYGVVRFSVNGEPVGEPVDLFGTEVRRTELLDLGRVRLRAGDCPVRVEIVGQNPDSTASYVGIDVLRFVPVAE